MNSLQDFWEKTQGYYDNERGKKCFKIVELIEREGILEKPLDYQRFLALMNQLRKILFI